MFSFRHSKDIICYFPFAFKDASQQSVVSDAQTKRPVEQSNFLHDVARGFVKTLLHFVRVLWSVV